MKRALLVMLLVLAAWPAPAAGPAVGLPDAQIDYLRSKRAQAIDRLARVLLSERKLAEARALLDPEIKRLAGTSAAEPVSLDDLRLVVLLGITEEMADAPAKRDEAFALVRRLTAPDERVHLLLGRAMADLHREDLTEREYRAVLETAPADSPYDALALRFLANVAQTNRRWAVAADLYGKLATRLRTAGPLLHERVGRMTDVPGTTPRERLLESVEYAALVSGGWARLEAGKPADWTEAMTSCEAAWRIDPEGIEACVLGERLAGACPEPARGDALKAAWRQRSDYALTTLRGAIATAPRDPANYNALAWFCAELGRNFEEGLRAAERALALRPAECAFLDTLAEIQFRSGDAPAAAKTIRRVVDLNPWANDYYRRQLDRFEPVAKKAPTP